VLNIKPLSFSIPKILKRGQNNRKSLDKSKLIKEKISKCPNNDGTLPLKVGVTFAKIQFLYIWVPKSGGNSQNSPSESLTVSGFQNIEQSQIREQ